MRGVSKTKFCKGTDIPKHSGNYSMPIRMHFASKEYAMQQNKDGIMIIGNHTIAETLLPSAIISCIVSDRFFKGYRREGIYKYAGSEYKCWMEIYKPFISGYGMPDYKFRLSIDTEGDFKFEFPEL